MKHLKKLFPLIALLVVVSITSCSKQGCTDPKASNYDPKADESDGSCIYPCTITCLNGGEQNSNCGCDCPTGYSGAHCETPPQVPDCQTNHTAKISFKNESGNHYTYDVVWDGSILVTLSYQTVSNVYTVAAGQHTLGFKIHGTNNYGCSQSNPNLAECSTNGPYYCTY